MVKRGVHANYMKTSNLTCKTLGMFRDQAGIKSLFRSVRVIARITDLALSMSLTITGAKVELELIICHVIKNFCLDEVSHKAKNVLVFVFFCCVV